MCEVVLRHTHNTPEPSEKLQCEELQTYATKVPDPACYSDVGEHLGRLTAAESHVLPSIKQDKAHTTIQVLQTMPKLSASVPGLGACLLVAETQRSHR